MNPERPPDQGIPSLVQELSMTATPTVKHTWDPLRISHIKPSITTQERQLAARDDLWHKIIVFGAGQLNREDVLDAVIAATETGVLLPLNYCIEHPDKGTFICKCTILQIENLVKRGLRIKTTDGQTLGVDIVLGFLNVQELTVNPQAWIRLALNWRYESGLKKALNLSNFQNDNSLGSMYCPLSIPRIFLYVLRCCAVRIFGGKRDSKLSIRDLNLSSNNMTCRVPFDKFFNYHLAKLDLRNNKIVDVSHLHFLSDFKITELWLDGNPLCENYATAEDYVRVVKMIFPYLQKLDGVMIGVEKKCVPVVQANYLGDGTRVSLVTQFIKHFFTFYDQDDRIVMNGLYDHDALFSTTLGAITNTNHSQMTKAFASNRNLLKFVDYAKCHEFLLHGPEKIIAALRRQPPTYHDYKTFNIDIIQQGLFGYSLVVAVQGFFSYKEFPYAPLFFNRTFVLVESDYNEFCIVNDQYHIQSETPAMRGIDKTEIKVGPVGIPRIVPSPLNPMEKEQMIRVFHECTTINEKFCRRYLENAHWNIRGALTVFMKDYTVNDVPSEAFRPISHP